MNVDTIGTNYVQKFNAIIVKQLRQDLYYVGTVKSDLSKLSTRNSLESSYFDICRLLHDRIFKINSKN